MCVCTEHIGTPLVRTLKREDLIAETTTPPEALLMERSLTDAKSATAQRSYLA
jgi:hypothetical protein